MFNRLYTFIQRHSLGLAAIGAILALGWGIGGAAGQTTDDESWHLMQKRYDGSVMAEGLTATMTRHECEFARARIMGLPATDEEKAADEKRRDAEAELAKADRAAFFKEHPVCNTDPPPTDKPECFGGFTGWPFGAGISTRMFSPNEIAGAECFQ